MVEGKGLSGVSGDGCECLVDCYEGLYAGSGVGEGTVGCLWELRENFARAVGG